MSIRKYEFTGEKQVLPNGITVSQIKALRDIPRFKVKEGDLGGWLQFSENLLEENDAWVNEGAIVYGIATVVRDNAYIGGQATVASTFDAYSTIGGDTFISDKAVVKNCVFTGKEITIRGEAQVESCNFYGKNIVVRGTASIKGVSIMESAKKVYISDKAVVKEKLLPLLIHGENVTIKDNARLIDVNRIVGADFTACEDCLVEDGVTFIGRRIHLSGASSLRGKLQVDNDVTLSECVTIFNDTKELIVIKGIELGGDISLPASTI